MMELDTRERYVLDEQDVQGWTCYWTEVAHRIGPIFARTETHTRAMTSLAGLLSPAERKHSWQLAEMSGAPTPYGFQHLLGRADWDPDALRDRLYPYVLEYLGDTDTQGILDETGFLKKGAHSVGVTRHSSGTAGRGETCPIGVFLTYAPARGQTLLDREVYLPTGWTDDPARCARTGVPSDRRFATKPELARQMLERAFAAGVRLAWVTGDRVYGDDRPLRPWREAQAQPYVLGIASREHRWVGHTLCALTDLQAQLADGSWTRLSCGMGSQGPRWYDWQWQAVTPPLEPGWSRWVLFRRSCTDPQAVDAYRVVAPAPTSLADLAQVVGMRWRIEESMQTAKGEVGLDHYEVRSWTGWYRHITLALWDQAFLTSIRSETGATNALKKGAPRPPGTSSLAAFTARRGIRSA